MFPNNLIGNYCETSTNAASPQAADGCKPLGEKRRSVYYRPAKEPESTISRRLPKTASKNEKAG